MSNLLQLAGPAVEPLTLADVKLHLRIDGDEEDALLSACITAARRSAEAYMRRALIAQAWQYYLDAWPGQVVRIPCPPLRSVTMIRIFDGAGDAVTLDPAFYDVDCAREPGRIAARGVWPRPGRRMGGIEITFEAGYGASWNDVPQDIRAGLLMAVALFYEQRGGGTDGGLPPGIAALWSPYRMLSL